MCGKRIIVLFIALIISVMVGALIYEAFDIHDTKPFPIDPEFLLLMLGSMLVLCVGIAPLSVHLLTWLLLAELPPLEHFRLSRSSTQRHQTFEVERLLFSPTLSLISLRI
jgi:hypothetical protein